jgi:MFS family permease
MEVKGSDEEVSPDRGAVYTVEDAVNEIGYGPFQVLLTVFCGLLWLSESMEFLLLSVLSPAVKCQWSLSNTEEALITSVVFAGFFIGGFLWGVIFDAIGRKKGLFTVNLVILIFGVLSALKLSADDARIPGYPWLLICRFGVGFGAGGAGQSVTYYTEFLPRKSRGICIVLLEVWWAIGSMIGAGLAIGVMREGGLGWHWMLGLAAIPLLVVIFLFPLVPESARFYLVKGKVEKAQKVINRIAWVNFKKVPEGRLVSQEEKCGTLSTQEDAVLYSDDTVTILSSKDVTSYDVTQNGKNSEDHSGDTGVVPLQDLACVESHNDNDPGKDSEGDETPLLPEEQEPVVSNLRHSVMSKFSGILGKGMWKTTVILQFLWFGVAWLYYGIVLLTTSLLRYDPHCGVEDENVTSNLTFCEETQLDTGDYVKILWAAAAELPGLLITLVVIEVLGRKKTMAIEFVICMIGFLLLFICSSDIVLTLFLFLIRAFTSGVFQAVYVYTPEVYPTTTRAFGMGLCQSSARIGAVITPFVAQVLLHFSDYLTLSLYAGSCLVCAVLSMLLPIETKGRALVDKH